MYFTLEFGSISLEEDYDLINSGCLSDMWRMSRFFVSPSDSNS